MTGHSAPERLADAEGLIGKSIVAVSQVIMLAR